MKRKRIFFCAVFAAATAFLSATEIQYGQEKTQVVRSVDAQTQELVQLSNEVWRFAETALKEKNSSRVVAAYLERHGFRLSRGVAGMPTAFLAEFGQGKPVIAMVGEFDALPGLSQQVLPHRVALEQHAPGHGCGHNLFGAASAGAAVAVKQLIEQGKLSGAIRFYGTPAEEAVGGKVYMIHAGLFQDVDVVLAWHPSTENEADVQSSQALVDFRVEFYGKAAHAAFDPWNGRSALDGLDLFMHALNLMREHVKPTVRIHYVIQQGGEVPNVVPESARLWCWIRDSRRDGVQAVLERAKKAAEGAALATETTVRFTIQGGDYEVLPLRSGGLLMFENLKWIGPLTYSAEEEEFARNLQRNAGVPEKGMNGSIAAWRETEKDPEGGSTDVGDVSWVVPVINLTTTTAPAGVPWHSWAVVASSGHSVGHKGMILAAKALGATAVDLFLNPEARRQVIEEFREKTKGHEYQSFVPPGPPPLP